LGLVGVAFVSIAAMIGAGLVIARGSGVTTIDSLAAFTLFAALVLAVSGVSIYSLGVTFNFLVSLFHRQPTPRGLFGDSRLERFFESRFGWIGLASIMLGVGLGAATLTFAGDAWDISRLWIWFLGGSAFTLVGFQLLVSWILARTLENLAVREAESDKDLGLKPAGLAQDAREHIAVGAASA
jgi:hypothetical protein